MPTQQKQAAPRVLRVQQLMGERAREMVRLELMLEDASVKLSAVASSLKTMPSWGRSLDDGMADPGWLARHRRAWASRSGDTMVELSVAARRGRWCRDQGRW